MPIAPLPQTTLRAIGSSSALSGPSSVVKELIDNALDAHATSISIEISPNTLDVIQVKDNGFAVCLEDSDFICKPNCTSKIQTLQDLESLGGTFLGFRGQALCNIAEMCGALTVTTRTREEEVATTLEFGRTGDLIRSV